MTANYQKGEKNPLGHVTADPDHDALYSNREKQREYLREKGYDDDEIDEILSGDDAEVDEGNV